MSTMGGFLFWSAGTLALLCALGTVLSKNALRAAMCLLGHIVALAGMYVSLNAHLLAAIQLLVYAGAVVVLFVFVIMLIGPVALEAKTDANKGLVTRTLAVGVVVLVFGGIGFQLSSVVIERPIAPEGFGSVESVAESMYQGAALPFELASVLLTVAVVAAIAVAQNKRRAEPKNLEAPSAPVIDKKEPLAQAAE